MNVAALAPVLQLLFTTRADELAELTEFIQRRRKFSGSDFLQALVLGWLKEPDAPLEALAQPLGISRQALQQRWTPQAVEFCRQALQEAVDQVLQARPEVFPLLQPFAGVFIDDATQFHLPDDCADTFPGCGSGLEGLGKASMKALVRWEIQGGRLHHVGIHPGRTADLTAAEQLPPPPKGSLYLADLAFTDFDRLQTLADDGVYWITRLPTQTHLYLPEQPDCPLWKQLQSWRKAGFTQMDVPARVGNKSTAQGRLIALACPPEVVKKRLRKLAADAKRRGRTVSARQREMCYWTVLFTNAPAAWLSALQVWLLYRLRWQIELLFKRFKSEGGLDESTSENPYRVQCECYLKLLGQVVRNWLMLLHGGPLLDVNAAQMGRTIADWLPKVFEALERGRGLRRVLRELLAALRALRPRTRRKKNKTVAQWLAEETPPD